MSFNKCEIPFTIDCISSIWAKTLLAIIRSGQPYFFLIFLEKLYEKKFFIVGILLLIAIFTGSSEGSIPKTWQPVISRIFFKNNPSLEPISNAKLMFEWKLLQKNLAEFVKCFISSGLSEGLNVYFLPQSFLVEGTWMSWTCEHYKQK